MKLYRKIGYKDCGSLVMDIPGYAQPVEMFMVKAIACNRSAIGTVTV